MHASVPLLLVAAREAAPAHVAGERLLAGVRAHVGGEVVAAAETAQADAALEGLVAGVDANVAIELVGAREAALAALNRAGEGFSRAAPFLPRGLALRVLVDSSESRNAVVAHGYEIVR